MRIMGVNERRYRNRGMGIGIRRYDYEDGFLFFFIIANGWHRLHVHLCWLARDIEKRAF